MTLPKNKNLTQERLKQVLDYDPETGIFRWNSKRIGGRKVGKIAGGKSPYGYHLIKIDGTKYMSHRLAWLYMYGYFPENEIDHINRIKDDNRISNLRHVSKICNSRNVGDLLTNKSGVKGVYFKNRCKSWVSTITINRKKIHLCSTKNFDKAVMERWKAEKEHNFPTCCTTSSSFKYLKEKGLINE